MRTITLEQYRPMRASSALQVEKPPRSLVPVFVLVLAAAAALRCAPAWAAWQALANLEHNGAAVSALVVDLHGDTVVRELNPNLRLRPASLTKLVTAAALLQTWPPSAQFQTRLLTSAPIRNGVLDGDLILQGAGDPSLDDNSLWSLAAQLKGYGVQSVTGHLVVILSPFGHLACASADRCRAGQRSDHAYNAPIASFGVDFGNWCMLVTPTRIGREALVRGCGVARLPIPVIGKIRTVPAHAHQTFWVERETVHGDDALHVGGDIPLGDPQQVYRAMSDPARGAAEIVGEMLRELGVHIGSNVLVTDQPAPRAAALLAQTEGLPLGEQLDGMLRYSNNYVADVLTMDLATHVLKTPPQQLASAAQALDQFMVSVRRAGLPFDPPRPVLVSGSGLTSGNLLSASDLIALLTREYRNDRDFPAFYGGLTVPHDAPFVFLRGGDSAWLNRVALKTGTLNDPLSVCGVSGYLRKRDGGWMAFAVIVNGTPRYRHVPLYKAMSAIESGLGSVLSRY